MQLYTQEEIDRLIGKQKEKLGIHDLWMQKRKLEWRTVPVEKYGTCVKEDMEGEMKWLLWHFLACAPDTFGEKYDLTQLYRNGILYGTGEIKELRFLAEQPCAVYEGMNVGIVRERGGIPDGDARIRIDICWRSRNPKMRGRRRPCFPPGKKCIIGNRTAERGKGSVTCPRTCLLPREKEYASKHLTN